MLSPRWKIEATHYIWTQEYNIQPLSILEVKGDVDRICLSLILQVIFAISD